MILSSLVKFVSSYRDLALLIFRVGLGGMYIWHGWPKIVGGPAVWSKLGQAMSAFGIGFAPTFWGFMASFAEFGGGLLFVAGLFYRFASFLLFFTMFTAFFSQIAGGKGLAKASQSFENSFSFFAAIFVGPGKYSIDYWLGIEEEK